MISSKIKRQKDFILKILLAFISLIISFCIGEVILRYNGHAPGYVPKYTNKKFRPVEKLIVSKKFLTDDEGVFKANPDGGWVKPIMINADGFRSIAFEKSKDGRTTSILLLGDSFAWGATAKPITNSFADILSRKGYSIFNTGIPGTDPKQYAYLAEKYIPQLKPEIVAVSFYMGNDIHKFRPMLPHKNLIHVTNVGWLQAFDNNGYYLTPQEAYQQYIRRGNAASALLYNNSKTFKNIIKNLLLKSAIGTNLLLIKSRIRNRLKGSFFHQEGAKRTQKPDTISRQEIKNETREYLLRIKRTAEVEGAKFILFVIPVNPKLENAHNSVKNNESVFNGLNYFIPNNLSLVDYRELPDDHFNNSGHKKFAQFMLDIIKAQTGNKLENQK